jgi:hypothetical protein
VVDREGGETVNADEWDDVWGAATELVEEHPDIVLIGGVAVYVHTLAFNSKEMAPEYTHDVDMAIDILTLQQLLDGGYDIVSNKRLSKRQLTIGGVEVDIYVQRQAKLRVGYDQLALWSIEINDVKIACLSHLLLLKLSAFAARRISSHGDKDRRDLAKILVMLRDIDDEEAEMLLGLVDDDDMDLMAGVVKSNAFVEIARKNVKVASKLRHQAQLVVHGLQKGRS